MASCKGKVGKGKITCNDRVLKCKKCGNVGCSNSRITTDKVACTNCSFEQNGAKCTKCGAWGPEIVK